MTCKDCIHFQVCDSGRHIGEYIRDDGIYSEGVEKDCEAFERRQEWISVDERLPEGDGYFIVYLVNHYGRDFVTMLGYTRANGWVVPSVTHWMPLSEPPMMKGGE